VRGNQARVKNADFASSVLHSCNVKTQICVTGPQCVNFSTIWGEWLASSPCRFRCPSCTYWTEGWVDPRPGLHACSYQKLNQVFPIFQPVE